MINFVNKSKKNNKKNKSTEGPPPPTSSLKQQGSYLYKNGILTLADSFKQETVIPLVHSIMEYNLMEEELQPERITLIINSPGGRIDSCLTLIDAMLSSEIPVDTFCTGMAASCGVVTLMAGKRRTASLTAQIMSHQYSAGSGGKEHELFGRVKSFEHTSAWMEQHYQACTGLTVKKIRKKLLCPTDVWMNANEAKHYNIIDEIVNPYENLETNNNG